MMRIEPQADAGRGIFRNTAPCPGRVAVSNQGSNGGARDAGWGTNLGHHAHQQAQEYRQRSLEKVYPRNHIHTWEMEEEW
jgi:hypothetical protein